MPGISKEAVKNARLPCKFPLACWNLACWELDMLGTWHAGNLPLVLGPQGISIPSQKMWNGKITRPRANTHCKLASKPRAMTAVRKTCKMSISLIAFYGIRCVPPAIYNRDACRQWITLYYKYWRWISFSACMLWKTLNHDFDQSESSVQSDNAQC